MSTGEHMNAPRRPGRDAATLGARRVLMKPFDAERLVAAVDDAITS